MTKSIFVIDSGVSERSTLLQQLPTDSLVIELNAQQDGVQQIASALANVDAGSVDALHIVSHGTAGALSLGSSVLNAHTLSSYSAALAAIGNSLGANGDILLYGCDVAAGEVGAAFIKQLAQVTGADVAASTDITGVGGDWVLEAQQGTIEAKTLDGSVWNGALASDDSEDESEDESEDGSEDGSGDGSEDGSGDGSEDGSGDGSEDGSGDGSEDGSGDGSEDGSGDGSEDGSGDGSEDGSGDGSEDGSGDGSEDGSGDGSEDGSGDGSVGTGNTDTITIDGIPFQNETLTAVSSGGVIAPAYQWLADGVEIVGESSDTLVLSQALVGKSITVAAVYTDANGTEQTLSSNSTDPILNLNDEGVVTIRGTATQNRTLTANVSDEDGVDAGAISYQWLANGAVISGATAKTLTLGQAQAGKKISVNVTYTDLQGTDEDVTSAQTARVVGTNSVGRIVVNGRVEKGQTLHAQVNDTDGIDPSKVAYQWMADGAVIRGVTGSDLVLGQSQVGKNITVKAIYTDALKNAEEVTSTATAKVANVNTVGSVTLRGTAEQGKNLTATVSDADGVDLSKVAYQWLADGVVIRGATSSTLALSQAQVGKNITAKVTYTDAQKSAEVVTSAATAKVANVNDEGSVTLRGKAEQGKTLTATVTDADGVDLSKVAYKWMADGVVIRGATSSTLTLGQAQVDKEITVKATYTDSLKSAEAITSDTTDLVKNVNDEGSVTVRGTAAQGQTLAATVTDADGIDLNGVTYKWMADGATIRGATASTLTLGQAQVGKNITVKAYYSDAFDHSEIVTSAETDVVGNVNDSGAVTLRGTAKQGQTLTATVADADGVDAGNVTYQWLASGAEIRGATASTFTLTSAQVGKAISVKASYTDAGDTREVISSAATSTVQIERINKTSQADTYEGTTDADYVLGFGGNDTLNGNGGNDTLDGGNGNDELNGGLGADNLIGGTGADVLIGGVGADVLSGGAGNDVFKFLTYSDSGLTALTRDVISDFSSGDKIDLSALDANTLTAQSNDAFNATFINSAANFTKPGQLQFKDGVLYCNTDSDSDAEFSIALTGVTIDQLTGNVIV